MTTVDSDGKITHVKGDTFYVKLESIKIDDVTINWTGYHAKFVAKTAPGGKTIIDLSDTSGINITTNGEMIITKTAATMASIGAGAYVYDLQITNPSGVVDTWLNKLPLIITEEVAT